MGTTLDDPKLRLIEIVSHAPEVQFQVGFGADMYPGLIKIALHFAASESANLSRKTATDLFSLLASPEDCQKLIFPMEATAQEGAFGHEVVAYPCGEDSVVTIELFGIFKFGVLLKGVALSQGARFYQNTSDGKLTVHEHNEEPPPLKKSDEARAEAIDASIKKRLESAFQVARHRDALKMLEVAHLRAFGHVCKDEHPTQNRFLELLEHELHFLTGSADLIQYVMGLARNLPKNPPPPGPSGVNSRL